MYGGWATYHKVDLAQVTDDEQKIARWAVAEYREQLAAYNELLTAGKKPDEDIEAQYWNGLLTPSERLTRQLDHMLSQ